MDGCGLFDVPSLGVKYTWSNKRRGEGATYEKLNRAMSNIQWSQVFSNVGLLVLPIFRSDHSPIVLDTHWQQKPYQRIRRFEEAWLRQDAIAQMTKKVWALCLEGSFSSKFYKSRRF